MSVEGKADEGRTPQEDLTLDTPSDDLLKLISNDSPADLPQSWMQKGGGSLWESREFFSVNGQAGTGRNGNANGNGTNGASVHSNGKHTPSAAPPAAPVAGPAASSIKVAVQLPGGKATGPLPPSLSALAAAGPPAQPPRQPRTHHQHVSHLHVHPNGGTPGAAQAMRHHPQHPQHHQRHQGHQNHQSHPFHQHQPHQLTPMMQQQLVLHAQQQAQEAVMEKLGVLQNALQQQQKLLQGREDEILQLQKALQERDEETVRLQKREEKLLTAKDAELAQLKQVLQKEKEEKLAKLNAAHSKRIATKDEELQQIKIALTKEREREVARLSASHAKQLKARDEELVAHKSTLVKDKDERIAKLSSSLKELKSSLSAREQEVAALKKQLGSAQRVEEDLRKQNASVTNAAQKEERQKNDALAKLKGSVEQAHLDELKKLSDEHTQEVGSKNKEMANLASQLKQVLQRYQTAQSALEREREKVKEALLESRNLAEVSMHFSAEEQAALIVKVQQHVEDCSIEEMHWMMTKEFRAWLAQSYTECDEVCDALEAEQQRLKRVYHSKEQDVGKMRARVLHLNGRINWVYQIFVLSMVGSVATGCVGAWRAVSTAQFWSSIQLMAFAWLVVLATAMILLFGDGGGHLPTPPAVRDLPRERVGERDVHVPLLPPRSRSQERDAHAS